jgi:basic membrane protein A
MMGRGDGIAEGALEASKEAGVFCVGDVIDQNSLAPDLLVTSTIWDLSVVFEKILSDMDAGAFKGGMYNMGMKEGATDIADFHGLVPEDIAAKVEAVRQQIIDGTFVVPVFQAVPTEEELAAAPVPTLP